MKKSKGKPGNAINLMVNSEGDGEGDSNEEQEEEDEDDEMQSAISDQDIENENESNNESQIKKQDNDLTQIGKFHHSYKKKDAEINLDGDIQSLAQGPNDEEPKEEKTANKQ